MDDLHPVYVIVKYLTHFIKIFTLLTDGSIMAPKL